MQDKDSKPNSSQIIIYRNEKGDVKLNVRFDGDTVWLSQKMMGDLFDVETNTINYHLKEIFKTAELQEDSVIRKIRITAIDGKMYETNFYNLDAIISVGYRVNSTRATQFRIWATQKLKEYIASLSPPLRTCKYFLQVADGSKIGNSSQLCY